MLQELLNYVPDSPVLQDRVIVVTGAASGIGHAVAVAYARFGATVVLLDKNVPALEATYDKIVAADYPEPAIYPLDLGKANQDDYALMAEKITENFGRLDGLVLNAAWLAAFMPIKLHEVDLWAEMFTINVHANFLILKNCLPLLEKAPDPAIVVSSDATSKPYYGGYGASKAALDALTDLVMTEYDTPPHFIRVNRINTGPVRTSLRTMHYPGENQNTLVRPENVVGPYLYFMSPDAGQRTGEAIDFGRLTADTVWLGNSV
ncbi:SDR family NAD(P)-dependent oxidoreductase [Thiofilum flexile]|uniref:SDR family NAD(P)-dependent oxidoreductase n=1 Tax=Thiofilum flexile TaxID=125627 RepID=UPI0003784E35|nr:SDR family NAD(P)-dependent oxidoreductase [Thiofilum flexile]